MTAKLLEKVLVVDDDEDTLTIVKWCFKKMTGIELRTVTSGEAALNEAPLFQPDIILLDMMMPGMDGCATLKALRALAATAHIPVVFFTAKVIESEIASYYALGALDVIIKPFDPITFVSLVKDIWQRFCDKK